MIFRTLLLSILIIIMAESKSDGQTKYTNGNLVRIGFCQKEVSPADTLGSWKDSFGSVGIYAYAYARYYAHITTPLRSYFIKKHEEWWESQYMTYTVGERILEKEGSMAGRYFATTDVGWDIMEPYMTDRTIVIETKNGYWLINGAFGNAFLQNNDSLLLFKPWFTPSPNTTMAERMRIIAGKVNDKYLAAFMQDNYRNYFDYYLISLESSPNIDSSKSVKVNFINKDNSGGLISGIKKISGDLYAVKQENKDFLDIYRLSADTFYYIKTTLEGEFSENRNFQDQWEFRNGKLYRLSNNDIASFEFNSQDTSFVNKEVLLGGLYDSYFSYNSNFGIDRNFKYAAQVFHYNDKSSPDTLRIFDIEKDEVINNIPLCGLKETFKPVVDSPYVYVHQITNQYIWTGIEDNKKYVIKDYELSAYPNPFNPMTTISYSIPEDQNVKLKVYDILGKEVSTLVDEYKPAGTYKVQFNAHNLPSGIYIYMIRTGKYEAGRKILLLK